VGLSALAAGLAGLVLAVHPLWVAHAGGPEAGTLGVAVSLALGAWFGGWATLLWLPCLLAEPTLWPHALLLLVVTWPQPTRTRVDRIVLGLGALACLTWSVLAHAHAPPTAAGLVAGLALLVALPLVVWVPRGASALWSRGGVARGTLVATILQLGLVVAGLAGPALRATWDGFAALAPAVAGAALVLAAGARLPQHAGDRRLAFGALALLLPLTLLTALGGVQDVVLGEDAAPAARLRALGTAMKQAAAEAGPEGWIALDLGDGTAEQAAALAAFSRGRPLLVTPSSGGPAEKPAGWPEGGPITLSLVTVRPEEGTVTTLGGYGIYAQEPAGRFGAYHVRRIRRP
jgi:hypothetical protein